VDAKEAKKRLEQFNRMNNVFQKRLFLEGKKRTQHLIIKYLQLNSKFQTEFHRLSQIQRGFLTTIEEQKNRLSIQDSKIQGLQTILKHYPHLLVNIEKITDNFKRKLN